VRPEYGGGWHGETTRLPDDPQIPGRLPERLCHSRGSRNPPTTGGERSREMDSRPFDCAQGRLFAGMTTPPRDRSGEVPSYRRHNQHTHDGWIAESATVCRQPPSDVRWHHRLEISRSFLENGCRFAVRNGRESV